MIFLRIFGRFFVLGGGGRALAEGEEGAEEAAPSPSDSPLALSLLSRLISPIIITHPALSLSSIVPAQPGPCFQITGGTRATRGRDKQEKTDHPCARVSHVRARPPAARRRGGGRSGSVLVYPLGRISSKSGGASTPVVCSLARLRGVGVAVGRRAAASAAAHARVARHPRARHRRR